MDNGTNPVVSAAQPKKKHTVLILNLVYIFIILALIGGGIYGYFYLTDAYETRYTEAYNTAVAKQEAIYNAAKKQYDEAYAFVLSEEADWKQQLEEKQAELNSTNKELEDIYAARQAEIDAENARWNALSVEEQNAELACYDYNDMVSKLRSTDPEYAKLYVEYAAYLTKDIFNLGREEALAYTKLYSRKAEIEQNYLKTHNRQ